MTEYSQIGTIGFAIASTVYGFLTILQLSSWRRNNQSQFLTMAAAATVIWAIVWATSSNERIYSNEVIAATELGRCLVWCVAMVALVLENSRIRLADLLRSGFGLFALAIVAIPVGYLFFHVDESLIPPFWLAGGYILSVLIVLSVELLYRNAPIERRSDIAYLSIAIAGVFVFDFVIYGLLIAGIEIDSAYWSARGYVSALFAVPFALGIGRQSRILDKGQAPRQMVLYTFSLTIITIYVAAIFFGNAYITAYGGSWSNVGGIVVVAAAVAAALTILASASIRARVRVLVTKSFFQYKYDYRKEWLRFIATLSQSGLENVAATAVRAVAQIVNSPGGVVWIRERGSDAYVPFGAWQCTIPDIAPVERNSELVEFIEKRKWVVNLEEIKQFPARYEDLQLERWLIEDEGWWLIVPVYLGERLYGFVVLKKPRIVPGLNFEDHDLLRTVGRHVGMHINQAESDRRLAETRQFGAYNRLTAFLMHDFNNLIAQQSLVVKNAERFRNNPKFVDDAIETIAHSVSRMRRLMDQLRTDSKAPVRRETDVRDALRQAVKRCRTQSPVPIVQSDDTSMLIHADSERLIGVFEHLIRNAQDATPPNGEIKIEARAAKNMIYVTIKDSGTGMSSEFIRERLFRPFDSTKGSESMGIGAYQARDYVRMLGGQLEVSSVVGDGTTFMVRLMSSA